MQDVLFSIPRYLVGGFLVLLGGVFVLCVLQHLVDALRKLRRQYTLIYWFVLIAVLLNGLLFLV